MFDFAVVCEFEADYVSTLILCCHIEGQKHVCVSSQAVKCGQHVSDIDSCLQIFNVSHLLDMHHCNIAAHHSIFYTILA